MAVKNIDVWRAARHLLDGHKGPALNEAAMRVKDAGKVGDAETEAVTLRLSGVDRVGRPLIKALQICNAFERGTSFH